MNELETIRETTVELAAGLGAAGFSRHFHPELSPLGWHLGHTAFMEQYWLREIMLGEPAREAEHRYYFPENNHKETRGRKLASMEAELHQARRRHRDAAALLNAPPARLRAHPLFADAYIHSFLWQHYAQHLETMRMIHQAAHLADHRPAPVIPRQAATMNEPDWAVVLPGSYPVGDDHVDCYDNEQPRHPARLDGYRIARYPVTNGEYLAFMDDAGYTRPELWDESGWAWCRRTQAVAPYHWRTTGAGWYAVGTGGSYPLDPAAPVSGISHHEARAFAVWAGARLPHEHEWETARRLDLLQQTGHAWEWCDNPLFPYPGFRAFPYEGYSCPWFDGRHFVLRGGSEHTEPELKRAALRNFHEPDKRHIFAGMRLAAPLP